MAVYPKISNTAIFFPSLSTISKGNANFYHVEVAQFPRVIMRSLTRRVKRTRDTHTRTIHACTPAADFTGFQARNEPLEKIHTQGHEVAYTN